LADPRRLCGDPLQISRDTVDLLTFSTDLHGPASSLFERAIGRGLSRRRGESPLQQQKEKTAIRRPMRAAPTVPKDGPRINDDIREREVHLIDKDGANRGTVSIS
jgi:hypothetical protein